VALPLYNRDLSWLSFNYRVLCMAQKNTVPLYERIRFLSIFSSNLDEFFRVRMPAILAIHRLIKSKSLLTADETLTLHTLTQVQQEIKRQLEAFGQIFTGELLPALQQEHIHLYYNEAIPAFHQSAVKHYFLTRVLAYIQPIWLHLRKPDSVFLENNALYLAVAISPNISPATQEYALVNIPSTQLPRFATLPTQQEIHYLALLDDVIRENLDYIFPGYQINACHSIKITRNAETDMDEFKGDILEQVEIFIKKRELGVPTRFLYDGAMPVLMQKLLTTYFDILPDEMVAGGRYHNLKDLADLPMPVHAPSFTYPKSTPSSIPPIDKAAHLLDLVQERDLLIHLPYQRYDYILRYFNEAAIDPQVKEIYITLYRVASGSQIVQALISAAQNGKQVTVFVELKARFDEENNIRWAKKMKAAGVKIIYSIPGLKVHAKIALVKRKRGLQWDYTGLLATGNFNESTARFYTDHVLLTSHIGITQEMELLFLYLQSREQPLAYGFLSFQHLLVAQFNLVDRFTACIEREIAHAQAGNPASIIIKLNNLQEKQMIAQLYAASKAGVKIQLIIRGICCLIPGAPFSSNINVIRIVDRYLEHARVFIFHNNGAEEVYSGSADWMDRNLHRRIEVCFPIYDPFLRQQLKDIIAFQLADNTNAALLDAQMQQIPPEHDEHTIRVNAQTAIQSYVQGLELT
jgi:polyphosphate kinase